jgi:hypothetical protein
MENNIPAYPNHAVLGIMRSAQMRSLMFERAEIAQAIYTDVVSKRTGRLARSARVETFIGGKAKDRWCGRLIVGEGTSYGLAHEFGYDDGDEGIGAAYNDLNTVLNMLGTL